MTKIKLCGIREETDILAANALSPDFVGFISTARFFRYIPIEKATKLKTLLNGNIRAVGVFVDEPMDYVLEYANRGVIDVIQLHGAEDEEYIGALKKAVNIPVWKAFKLTSEEDIPKIEKCSADLVLLDSGQGTGKPFDWALLKGVKRKYVLAGGLNTENVKAAVEQIQPYGVDVSSGIETDRKKDKDKMNKFVGVVREADERSKS